MQNPGFTYAIIPHKVLNDKELQHGAKLLVAHINDLSASKGYCWANNEYLAKLLDASKPTITRWLGELTRKNYVVSQLIYKSNSREIKERRIIINKEALIENNYTPPCQQLEAIGTNNEDNKNDTNKNKDNNCINKSKNNINKDILDNNIISSNQSEDNSQKFLEKNKNNKEGSAAAEGGGKKETIDSMINAYSSDPELRRILHEFKYYYKSVSGHYLNKSIFTRLLDELSYLAREKPENAVMLVDYAIMRGWKAFYPIPGEDFDDED